MITNRRQLICASYAEVNVKDLNIARIIAEKRREAGVTQEELAAYMGVTKASVSKWETGQSCPDISFLPQLASYFNISVDELLGYEPQMKKEDIRRLYNRLAEDFAEKPFNEVMTECRGIVKKYCSCYELLYQMAVLMINHCNLAGEPESQAAVLHEVADLCIRIRAKSGDIRLAREAAYLEAAAHLLLRRPEPVLELFGEETRPLASEGEILAQAYMLLGNKPKAMEKMQIYIYQYLLLLADALAGYLTLIDGDGGNVDETVKRAFALAGAFNLKMLNPNIMARICYASALAFCRMGNTGRALDMLDEYAGICAKDISSFKLRGDGFFNSIDGWLKKEDIGGSLPRSEKLIRESILQAIEQNPVFAELSDNPRFKLIMEKLSLKEA